jgi:cytoskeletal protein CcmA (bactofilin family)
MFSRRSENSAPSTVIVTPDESDGEHLAMASVKPVGGRDQAGHHSIVDGFLTMRGDLESNGDILVQGKVLGNIKCKLLIIDTDALVDGGIEAEDVVIRGKTKGTILADRVRLDRTADVDSEICQLVFSAEEGARIRGTIKMKQTGGGKEPAKKEQSKKEQVQAAAE